MKGKSKFNHIFFSGPELKKRFRFRLKNDFLGLFMRGFEINLVILLTWIRTGSVIIKFCGSGYNPSSFTLLD